MKKMSQGFNSKMDEMLGSKNGKKKKQSLMDKGSRKKK